MGSGSSTPGGGQSIGGRLLAERSAFRQRLVAIWYSQTRTEERPSNPARPCQAASRVSWSASSASSGRAEDPVAVHLQLAPVGADEFAERLLVAGPGPVYQVRAHRATLSPSRRSLRALLPVPTPPGPETGRRPVRQPPAGVYMTDSTEPPTR